VNRIFVTCPHAQSSQGVNRIKLSNIDQQVANVQFKNKNPLQLETTFVQKSKLKY
jgi:hypothetical protein